MIIVAAITRYLQNVTLESGILNCSSGGDEISFCFGLIVLISRVIFHKGVTVA